VVEQHQQKKTLQNFFPQNVQHPPNLYSIRIHKTPLQTKKKEQNNTTKTTKPNKPKQAKPNQRKRNSK